MDKHEVPLLVSVMTPFPYHIEGSASIATAIDTMVEHDVHYLA